MKNRTKHFSGSPSDATCFFDVWAKHMEEKEPGFEVKNVTSFMHEDREDNCVVATIIAYYTLN